MKPSFKMCALAMILTLILSSSAFAQCAGGSKIKGDEGATSTETVNYGDDQPTEAMEPVMEEPFMEEADDIQVPEEDVMPESE